MLSKVLGQHFFFDFGGIAEMPLVPIKLPHNNFSKHFFLVL